LEIDRDSRINSSSGILKNPSFSGPSGPISHHSQISPTREDSLSTAATAPLDPQDSKEITLQNTIQNAGARRSSSAARRALTAARRHSLANAHEDQDDEENMRLKWDEANLYLAEQERGSRMKITEPKTPYEYGRDLPPEDELDDEDVAIDPKYVNVDEVDMAKNKRVPRHRESEIPGLELGEPEEEYATTGTTPDDARIFRGGKESLSREGSQGSSREKHVSVSEDTEQDGRVADVGQVGMPTKAEMEKHRKFEEMRKKHYEMKDIKGLLG
jgi:protein phosphatase inhibitor 2